jgi:hypothetical protein
MKNSKIKIETDSEKLSKEEISKHKDFNKVYKTFTTTKTIKVPSKFGGLRTMVIVSTTVVVTTVGAYTYWKSHKTVVQPPVAASTSSNTRTATTSSNTSTTTIKKPYVNPPIKGVDVPYKNYSVDATKGGTLVYNKSKLIIPAAAFVDANGNDITGKVDIKYREFHNTIDFFASGIPMTYDSAGQQYTFESAGMLDVRGYQNGKQVFIKTGKDIKITMASTQTQTHYNVYYLDTVKQNWDYKSKSNYVAAPLQPKMSGELKDTSGTAAQDKLQQIQTSIASVQKEEVQLEKKKPFEPKKVDNAKNVFNIEADASEFPELGVYKNMLFEADPTDQNYKPSYSSVTWDDASLKRNADGATYMFTVKKGTESHSFIVRPVFEGKDYDAAMKEYNKKYDDYKVAYDKRKADEKKQQDAYDALLAKIKQQQMEEENRMVSANTAWAVTNYFTINNFGVWNSDNPGALPRGAELRAQYTDNKSDDLNDLDFYLVQKNVNALYIYHPGHNCRFNPEKPNYAWIVTPESKIAIYTIDDFKGVGKTTGDFTFNMKVVEKKITCMDDIKEVFKPYM